MYNKFSVTAIVTIPLLLPRETPKTQIKPFTAIFINIISMADNGIARGRIIIF